MADNSQFLVSMKFIGVNEVSPQMKKMADDAKKLKQQVSSLGSGPNGGFKWMDSLNKGLKAASDTLGKMKKTMNDMKFSGIGNIMTGGAALAPVLSALNSAGKFQQGMITISGATGANAAELADLKKTIRDASNVTKFSSSEVQGMAIKAATSGMTVAQVQQLTPIMAKFAEVQQFGKGTGSDESVTDAISSAHMLGIYDPKQLDSYLNNFNKATFMTPGSTSEFFDTFKYLAPTAKGMGMSNDDILYTSALSNRVGMLGSMGGTEAADMILRSIPGIFGGDGHVGKDGKFKASKQLGAMMDLGLAKSDGSSVFFNKKGEFQGIQNFITQLSNASKGINPERLMKDFKNMFGMQGERLAVILSERGGEQLQVIQKQMESMKSITQLQDDYNQSYEGQLAQFKTNLQNLNMDVGTILLPTATNLIHSMQPMVTNAATWISTHEGEVKKIAEVTAEFGLFMLALGGAKLALGTFGTFLAGPLKQATDGVLMSFNSLKKQAELPKELPEQVIRASVVNVYGAEINGGGVGGLNAGGEENPGGLPSRSSRMAGKAGKWARAGKAAGGILKGSLKRGGAMLPVSLALGAWDVATAPEGQKVKTAVKASGSVIGGWAGVEAGAAMGAAIGSIVPGLGTAIGGLLGGAIGGIAGGIIGDKISESAYNAVQKSLSAANSGFGADDVVESKRTIADAQRSQWENQDAVESRRSMYAQMGQKAFAGSNQNNYNDSSSNTFYIQSTDPQRAFKEILDQNNLVKKDWWKKQTSG